MTDEDAIVEQEAPLHKALTRGQITVMGPGRAIGTGLFMGSVIATAGRQHNRGRRDSEQDDNSTRT